jgi:NaMN:DMB phosphoribosyltransferase
LAGRALGMRRRGCLVAGFTDFRAIARTVRPASDGIAAYVGLSR